MYEKRTDLALEIHEIKGEESGIEIKEEHRNGVEITIAKISSEEGERLSGKPSGDYFTINIGKIWLQASNVFKIMAKVIGDCIAPLIPNNEGCVLVVGLGNREITPDSLGPRVAENLIVTRHIEKMDPELYNSVGFGNVAAIVPKVLGQTGVESAEIVKSVTERIKPKCVILVDALASRRVSRLATTVQISSCGITPGSGVSNHRNELSEKTLGVPVISIGVPMVVDGATLAHDILEEHFGSNDPCFEKIVEKLLSSSEKGMFVTPKETDVISRRVALLVATALNVAIHGLEIDEINEYIN